MHCSAELLRLGRQTCPSSSPVFHHMAGGYPTPSLLLVGVQGKTARWMPCRLSATVQAVQGGYEFSGDPLCGAGRAQGISLPHSGSGSCHRGRQSGSGPGQHRPGELDLNLSFPACLPHPPDAPCLPLAYASPTPLLGLPRLPFLQNPLPCCMVRVQGCFELLSTFSSNRFKA